MSAADTRVFYGGGGYFSSQQDYEQYEDLINKAVDLGEHEKPYEAIQILEKLLAIRPGYKLARLNRAILLMQIQRFEEAIDDYNRVLEEDSVLISLYKEDDLTDLAKFGRGFSNLVLGNLRAGFIDFEYRKKQRIPSEIHPLQWKGQSIVGKTIVIIGEPSFGDNLMFVRYAQWLVQERANVMVAGPASLQELLRYIPNIQVLSEHSPKWDYWVHMMSLAFHAGTDIDTIPPPAKFDLPIEDLARWHRPSTNFKVGVCWSGSRISQYDKYRNIPLRSLYPLFDIPGYDFYSLVIDVRESDQKALNGCNIFDGTKSIRSFRDTACLISSMDLVITVDTAIAHLAGTLGVPTWVMLTSYRTYWLWIKDRIDNPWYPSMRAFRQTKDGDWSNVVSQLGHKLKKKQEIGELHV